jgi:uncharacterized protein (TIGR02996 family)
MSAEDDLLREILAHPAADEPRKKYGELLEQRGDPRGEFIRIQYRFFLAWLAKDFYDLPNVWELSAREETLLKQHGAEWSRDVRPLVEDVVFERGFVDCVTISAGDFLERAEALYAVAPVIQLYIRQIDSYAERLFSSPHMGRIQALALGGAGMTDSDMKALAASPHLRQLRWLDLTANNITEVGMEALFASPNIPNLLYLKANSNDCNDREDISDTPMMTDGGIIYEWGGSKLGFDLEKKYGEKAWLHYRTRDERYRFPGMSAV